MSYTTIPDSKREIGMPVDQDLIENIHENFEDLNSRVNAISIAAGSAVLLNQVLQKPLEIAPIGSIIFASRGVTQFIDDADGGEWRLANGSSAAGTDWATQEGKTNLPDLRGRFVRGKDNGAGNAPTDPALDTAVTDSIKSHDHTMNHGHSNTFGLTGSTTFASDTHKHLMNHEHWWGSKTGNALNSFNSSGSSIAVTGVIADDDNVGTAQPFTTISSGSVDFYTGGIINPAGGTGGIFSNLHFTDIPMQTATVGFTGSVTSHSGNTGSTGAAETVPKHVIENAFIKVNKGYIETKARQFIIRVPQDLTINNVLVSPVVQGTSGSLVIDIKKGATPASATTSIFQSGQQPTLAWNATSGVTGLIDSSKNEVSAGEFIVVSITAVQAKLEEVHLYVGGDY